ncbi:MAG: amino acid permease, partial [Lentisphaeria bacterium]|nr:amino acid permease [Lentisphaeria bacterium]
AVGWGSFVLPGTMFLPQAGPLGTIIGLLVGTLAVVVFTYNYHKVISSVRGSGGTYGFITKVFGYNHGFLVGWFLFLTYVAIMWANATALVLLARYLFGNALQFGFHYTIVGFDVYFGEVLLCLAAILLCGGACLIGKRFAIRLHTFFAIMLLVGVMTCFVAALLRHGGGVAAMAPAFSTDGSVPMQLLRIFAMVPWAFVGFEAVVQSSSEFRFPLRRTFSLLLAAILLSALTYCLLVLLPVLAPPEGYANWKECIDALPRLKGRAGMPVFAAAERSLGTLGVAVLGGSMLSAQLTAHFATYIAVSRLMRAMSDDDMLPKWFGRCGGDGTPVNAILLVMAISLPMPFLGRTVIGWPVDLSNLGAAIAYGYTSAAALALLKKERKSGRFAEKSAGVFGLAMAIVFSLLMLVPNYLSGSSISTESYLLLSLWCFVGFALYRRVFIMDSSGRAGNSTVVWITVLVVIFFSSLMWFRLAVRDAAEQVFGSLIGTTVTAETVRKSTLHVSSDMLFKSMVELALLVASLAIMLNLISILHKREKGLIVGKLKAEESANRSKSYFFSTINHDIRTPLNAIIGYSQMLKLGFRQEEDREQALNSMIDGSRSLLRFVNDLIDFARLEDGRLEFEPKPTDCGSLLHDFVDFFREAKRIQAIELRCRADDMPTVLIDPKRIRQILFHLTDNAAKFTRKGFVELRVSFVLGADGAAGTLRFEVEDTGIGIGEEDLKRIASPYVQVEAKHSRHGGTGIGVALCRKLADAMGGELSIASVLGQGSVFTVTLNDVRVTDAAPVADHDQLLELLTAARSGARCPAPDVRAEAKEAPAAASKRVLIVDDQKVNLMVLKAMLKKLGISDVAMAKDGREALDLLTSSTAPFDLVLTDMWMPIMDGEGLVRTIRADGRFAAIPVHVVTADTEMQGKYAEIGFDGIMLKPVTVNKLKGIIG